MDLLLRFYITLPNITLPNQFSIPSPNPAGCTLALALLGAILSQCLTQIPFKISCRMIFQELHKICIWDRKSSNVLLAFQRKLPRKSAWICISKSFFVIPPSTKSFSSLRLLSVCIASRISRTWKKVFACHFCRAGLAITQTMAQVNISGPCEIIYTLWHYL